MSNRLRVWPTQIIGRHTRLTPNPIQRTKVCSDSDCCWLAENVGDVLSFTFIVTQGDGDLVARIILLAKPDKKRPAHEIGRLLIDGGDHMPASDARGIGGI